MNQYKASNIRNIGLFAHGGAGKTSLAEAMLFNSGAINRIGRVEDGNTASDWDPEEHRRNMSISTSVLPVEWQDHKINVLDSPGYADFVGEVKSAMKIANTAIILLDASAGVEVGTEFAWRFADDQNIPRILVVNKMDRENANFSNALDSAQSIFGNKVVPLLLPIGQESNFRGYIDLLAEKAYLFGEGNKGEESEVEIPEELLDEVETYRLQIVEGIAENDEDLMMKYLEDEPLTKEELTQGMKSAVASGDLVPVLLTAATTNRGVKYLMNAIVDLTPQPGEATVFDRDNSELTIPCSEDEPTALFVWKSIADPFVGKLNYFYVMSGTVKSDSHLQNVEKGEDERIGQVFVLNGKEQMPVPELYAGDIGAVSKLSVTSTNDTLTDPKRQVRFEHIEFPLPMFSAAVHPKTNADLDKMGESLQRLMEEDPSIVISRNDETNETIISGLGESHVQITLDRMSRKFGVNVEIELPTIPYRETITTSVTGVEYRHRKQTGGHGQYGHVYLDVSPCEEDFVFEQTIFGGSVPRQYIPAVEKGVVEAMEHGSLAGFPVTNVKVVLTDGSYHTVDSSEMAFKLAAFQAFRMAQNSAHPVILEPINEIEVTIPESYTGDVMGDLTSKRAHVTGMVPGENGETTIQATVPAAEILRYATDLRSLTQGRGTFTTEFLRFEQVPPHLTDGIVSKSRERDAAAV